eukprot:gnl/MRDRNA2_/MRDRNA2_92099_c0_seq1.p1 gnl/MRDRNA2_/MRDRNA2_92099_c0~~gnl/MRDRNA2_/MRDRNA2_92099_c0_seq1.p1  ORF type:complete len:214 (+),score=80.27 gnl/MRDRNA2_/MRDRNA2_92099_c0_seq1:112-753(+)
MKCYSAALCIFMYAVAPGAVTASQMKHHYLAASGDAGKDAMDAIAIRKLAAHAKQRATADSAHLRGVANAEAKAAEKRESEVQEMLEDAQAIDAVVRLDKNQSDMDVDETEDAQQLRQVAVIEEEQVISDQKAVQKLKADADAIATSGGETNDAEVADAKVLEVFAANEAGDHKSKTATSTAPKKAGEEKGKVDNSKSTSSPKKATAQKKKAF